MKYAAIAAGVFALCILTFWAVYVRAPSPEEVCQHKIDLVLEEAPEGTNAEPLVASLQKSCVSSAERKIQLRGKLKYANYARCVVAATELGEAERCSTGS
jgi:hypothetical protein